MKQIVSSAYLRHRLAQDFKGHGRYSRLAEKLGLSTAQAATIMAGKASASLVKAAALYGFAKGENPDEWIKSQTKLDPKRVGQRRWTDEEVQTLIVRVHTGRSVASVAKAVGVTPDFVYKILSRRGVSIAALRKDQ